VRSRSYIYATLPDFKYPAMFDMMLKGLHNRGHVVTAGDSADKDISGTQPNWKHDSVRRRGGSARQGGIVTESG
jgi:hypothetical protein